MCALKLVFYCSELEHKWSSFSYYSTGCKELESRYLVPGDVFLLDGKKLSLPCDAILIDGSCVVNEGMLTGAALEFEMLTPCAGSLSGRCLSVLTENCLLFIRIVCSRRWENCGLNNSQLSWAFEHCHCVICICYPHIHKSRIKILSGAKSENIQTQWICIFWLFGFWSCSGLVQAGHVWARESAFQQTLSHCKAWTWARGEICPKPIDRKCSEKPSDGLWHENYNGLSLQIHICKYLSKLISQVSLST